MKQVGNQSILTGIAGVHHVVAQLSLRGMTALPTVRNTPGYDIIVASRDGKKHANLQVKTSAKRVNNWLMPRPSKIRTGPHDFYVLVRRDKGQFDTLMLSGREAHKKVRTHRRKKAVFYALHVGGKWKKEENRWRRFWMSWKL